MTSSRGKRPANWTNAQRLNFGWSTRSRTENNPVTADHDTFSPQTNVKIERPKSC